MKLYLLRVRVIYEAKKITAVFNLLTEIIWQYISVKDVIDKCSFSNAVTMHFNIFSSVFFFIPFFTFKEATVLSMEICSIFCMGLYKVYENIICPKLCS